MQNIIAFLKAKEAKGLRQHSLREYRFCLERFRDIVGKSIAETTEDYSKFLNVLSLKYAPKTVLSAASIYLCFLKFWNGEGKGINVHRLWLPKVRQEVIRAVTDDEFSRLLEVTRENEFLELQRKLILLILWYTGLRIGELVSIKLEDIKYKQILIHTEKSYKLRTVFINDETQKVLDRFLNIRREIKRSEFLFLGIYRGKGQRCRDTLSIRSGQRAISVLCGRAKIRSIHPHLFRHARIQKWLEVMNPSEVMRLSGHENVQALEHYTRYGLGTLQRKAELAF